MRTVYGAGGNYNLDQIEFYHKFVRIGDTLVVPQIGRIRSFARWIHRSRAKNSFAHNVQGDRHADFHFV